MIKRQLSRDRGNNFMNYNAKHFDHLKPNPQFSNYKNVFQNLLQATNVSTDKDEIVNVQISYDSSTAIAVVKKTDYEYGIKMYALPSLEQIFDERIGGEPHQYIKMNGIL